MPDQLIRCFIAIRLPEDILNTISDYLNDLRKLTSNVRWVRPESIHLTLKFLGEVEPRSVERVKDQLSSISGLFSPFDLCFSGSGCFPGKKRPRVFWLGMEESTENTIFEIYQWIENRLQPLGFEKEKRRYSPHLTLGRVKRPENFSKLFAYLNENPISRLVLGVKEIYFMQSLLKPSGAEYRVIDSYIL
jgi:2'-5' RNA ligase